MLSRKSLITMAVLVSISIMLFANEKPEPLMITNEITIKASQPPNPPLEVETDFVEEDTKNLECLALNIYHESRSDSFAGKLAVADVTINRVQSNLFPNDICEVVKQTVTKINWKGNEVPVRNKCQFSWYCDGKSDAPREQHAWEESISIANTFMVSDQYQGITEGATHYHTRTINPVWVNDRGMRMVGIIGEHKFYRWH